MVMVLGGSGTITSDKITTDANGNFGIGTNSPSTKLQIKANNVVNKGQILIDSADYAQISAYNGSTQHGSIYLDTSGGGGGLVLQTLTAQPIRLISNGTEYMRVDTSGRVTKPYQPIFYARHNNNSSASGRYGLFDDVLTNQGGHASHSTFGGSYSYTRFTCPIAGKYFVWVGNIGPNTGTTQRTYVHKNGSNNSAQLRTGQTSNHGTSASMNVIIDAAANDWIACYSASDDGSMAFYSGEYSHMGVILIG